MDKVEIKLKYRRVGELYQGSLHTNSSAVDFEGITFARMMSNLAAQIRMHDSVTVELSRAELPNSEYRMDAETVELLRVDPAAAIRSMTHEDRTVHVKRVRSVTPPAGLLRAGHDTVAATFGDFVYAAVSATGRIECPGCGRWAQRSGDVKLQCPNADCQLEVVGVHHGERWYAVPTALLVEKGSRRFYLPRAWNPSGGWISHKDLSKLFRDFIKERDDATR